MVTERRESHRRRPRDRNPHRRSLRRRPLRARLLSEEYAKLLAARDRDVHDDSKATTLPIAREIVAEYVTRGVKPPWYIDLLNLSLNNYDLATAKSRIRSYIEAFERDGTRITENLNFG